MDKEARLAGGVKETEEDEEYIYAVKDDEVNIHAFLSQVILSDSVFDLFLFHLSLFFIQQSDDEGREQMEGENGAQTFFAHVPVPSQKEVG